MAELKFRFPIASVHMQSPAVLVQPLQDKNRVHVSDSKHVQLHNVQKLYKSFIEFIEFYSITHLAESVPTCTQVALNPTRHNMLLQ